jgi:hypothetical protein
MEDVNYNSEFSRHIQLIYKDGNGQGMGRVEQYHTHTCIVDGYIILPVPIPMGVNLYPYPYPAGTHTHWVPNGWIKYYTSYSLFYFH